MSETVVVNIKRDRCDVYIGRAMGYYHCKQSIWHNPFKIGRDGTREEVIAKYRAYLQTRPDLLARLGELRGKRLGCWCKTPGQEVPCHGDVLAELADGLAVQP